jgi:hypothetical protein
LSSARKSDQDKSVRSGREKPAAKHCFLLASCERPSLLFPESDAASDFASVMTQIRQGAEVIFERDAKPDAVVCPAHAVRGGPFPNPSPWRGPMLRSLVRKLIQVWQYRRLVARANMVFSKMA